LGKEEERTMYRIISIALVALSLSSTPALAQRFHPRSQLFPFFGPNVNFVSTLPSGHFVVTAPGSLNLSTHMFSPAATGNSLLIGQGAFTPANGTFVPMLNGNFILATREAFNPKTRSFVPSSTGAFVFATRGDLVASPTGKAVPSFLPFTSLVPPVSTSHTVTNLTVMNPYVPGGVNPYTAMMANPYGASTPPYSPYTAAYGGGNYGAAPYGAGAYAAASTDTAARQAPQETVVAGVPLEDGHIKWPLAFRLLPPDAKRDLVDRLETNLLSGNAEEGKKGVARLSSWLAAHRTDLAEGTYQDGLAFLRTLDEAFAALR
jgi:hypothetical protein